MWEKKQPMSADVEKLGTEHCATIPALDSNCFQPFIKPRTHQSDYINGLLRSLENLVKTFCLDKEGKEERLSADFSRVRWL